MKRKRILAFLLSMVMILSLAPMSIVWAEGGYVASITSDNNTVNYTTFEEALTNAVTGDTIKVIGNTSYTGAIDKDVDIAVQAGAEFTLFYDEGTDTGEFFNTGAKKFKSRFCNADIIVEDGGKIKFNQTLAVDSVNPRYLVMNGDFELKNGATAILGKAIANGGGVLFQGNFKNDGSFNAGGSGNTATNVTLYLKCGATAGTITNGEPIYNFCITQPSDETIKNEKIKITKINGDLTFGGILTAEVDGFGDSSKLPDAVGRLINWDGQNFENNKKGKEYKIVAEDVGGTVKAKMGSYANATLTFKYAYLAVKDEIVTYIKNGEKNYTAQTDVILGPDKVYLGGTNAKDTNTGTSEQQALATFSTAVNLVKDGGEIVVCGDVQVSQYSFISKNVTITGKDDKKKYSATLMGGTEKSPNIVMISSENLTFAVSNIKMDGVFQFASFYDSNICEFTDITCSDDVAVLAYASSYYEPFKLNVTNTKDFYIMASNSGLDKAFDINVDNSDMMLQKYENSFANVTLKNNSTLSTDMTLYNLTSDNTNNAIEPRMDSEGNLNTLYIEKTVTTAENFPISVIFSSTVPFGKVVFSSTTENISLTADKFKLSQVGTKLEKKNNDIVTTPQTYNINYVLDEGTLGENSPLEHTYGTDTTLVAPTKSGYNFDGWYLEDTFENKVETLTADGYTDNITLYAKWNKRSSGGGVTRYTVKFNTNGGNTITSQTVKKNSTATEPTKPTKDGYIFDGWYTDSKFTTEYDFDTKVTKNITLYAKWTEDEIQEPNDDKKDDEQKPTTDEWENPFDDVKDNEWYFDNVKYANENDLMTGITSNTFAPNENITRGMFVTVLYRAEGEPAVNKSIPFADVNASQYYANAVIWAEQNGIVKGVSETEFAPDENITREQIAAIIYRYAVYKEIAPTGAWAIKLDYSDVAEISDYAVESVMYCTMKNIMQGKDNNMFAPKDNATRAEIAAILNRFIESNK